MNLRVLITFFKLEVLFAARRDSEQIALIIISLGEKLLNDAEMIYGHDC